jgi:hypothetical protein
MALTLTSANTVVSLSVPSLLGLTILQGYAPDDIYTIQAVNTAENMMGLDAILSSGYVPSARDITFKLMANSPSIAFFEAWGAGEDQALDKYPAFGIMSLPGLGKQFILTNGFLGARDFMPNAGKVLMPQTFSIAWQKVVFQGIP